MGRRGGQRAGGVGPCAPAWAPDGSAVYVAYQAQKPSGALDVGIDRVELASGGRSRVVANAAVAVGTQTKRSTCQGQDARVGSG
jgi:hypothetical protein